MLNVECSGLPYRYNSSLKINIFLGVFNLIILFLGVDYPKWMYVSFNIQHSK
jgi:hypothetical protein